MTQPNISVPALGTHSLVIGVSNEGAKTFAKEIVETNEIGEWGWVNFLEDVNSERNLERKEWDS